MLYKNNIGPQVRRRRYALGWSQSMLAKNSKLPASISPAAAFRRSKHGSALWTIKTSCSSRRY